MKKLILASAIASAFAGQVAYAADAAPAPAATPEHVVTYNMGVTNNYLFRGISQSRNSPALSGGVDYTHSPTGLYVGTWASTINWVNDYAVGNNILNPTTSFEVDLYGGVKGEITKDVTYDLGAIYYYYPGEKISTLGIDANTLEAYGQVGYGPVYAKLSYALTEAFATGKAGTYYIDTGANVPLGDGLVANVHAGYFYFKGYTDYNYTDYKIGLTKDFGGISAAVAVSRTNADKGLWNFGGFGVTSDTKYIASLTKTF
jgi:uncharacterized protein (TIGR02001 family)